MSKIFDYVIVGAGSAGCVLANRLTANGRHNVCLVEAGGSNRHPFISMPSGWAATLRDPRFDWGYRTQAEPELGDRRIYWPRGRGLGGSSAINGMVYIRGNELDYQRWVQAGAAGWSYDELLPYFKKSETQQTIKDDYHGLSGPVHVQDPTDLRSVHNAFVDAALDLGLPRNADFNGKEQAGTGYYQFHQRNGMRWSASDAYLKPARKRPNLTIENNAFATQIIFEGKTASGLKYTQGGKEKHVNARHIILCGGSINSPQLLELSGIGDEKRLKALGIPLIHHLPDVGENLQDHILSKVVYESPPSSSINREVQGWRLGLSVAQWLLRRNGPLSMGAAPCGGFAYINNDAAAPDIQFLFGSGATLNTHKGKIRALPIPALSCAISLNRPESTGSIHIKTTDPSEAPEIRANYLSTERDKETMLRGLRLVDQIFQQKPMVPFTKGRISPKQIVDLNDDDALLAYLRKDAGTAYHPTSTCAIGRVVNPELSVYGVEGLSIADASVMPVIISGNTHATSVVIGEKASDIVLGYA